MLFCTINEDSQAIDIISPKIMLIEHNRKTEAALNQRIGLPSTIRARDLRFKRMCGC
jgi:hypothetical protein